MSSIAVITARGGSKRIPHKNIKDFCGKPIIAYSIEAALESGLFDEVMVSTDDEEIAEIARVFGASVPFMRSSSTSDDYATTSDVLLEVLDAYESQGRTFDSLCCIYPTAPFVTAGKLHAARSLFEDGADTVLVVTEYSFPPQRGGSAIFLQCAELSQVRRPIRRHAKGPRGSSDGGSRHRQPCRLAAGRAKV